MTLMKLFSKVWLAAREDAARRMHEIGEERRAARKACRDEGHKKVDDRFVVPDYLEHSAGKVFVHCPRCDDWRLDD